MNIFLEVLLFMQTLCISTQPSFDILLINQLLPQLKIRISPMATFFFFCFEEFQTFQSSLYTCPKVLFCYNKVNEGHI